MRLIAIIFLCVLLGTPATASETDWVDHGGVVSTRLVSTSAELTTEDGFLLAWEAKLEPGWKTYWRSPGEAGLPVRVFLEGTEIAPLYPMPHRFELFGIQTYGYGQQLLLPFHVPEAMKHVMHVKVDFMVCKDVCIPFEQTYDLPSEFVGASGQSLHDIRVETWLSKVPATEGAPGGLEISSGKIAGRPGHQKLIVDVAADSQLSNADLLAEVSESFHFGAPRIRLLEDGTKARLVLAAMVNGEGEDLRGQPVRLTFTDGNGHAIDRTMTFNK